jgi:L-seryl-tRNA(Ser) seleniumtransferase
LIEAARLNMSPMPGVGRPAKVGKEEIIGLLAALERFANLDHEARWQRWRDMAERIAEAVRDIDGLAVTVEEENPPRQGPQPVVYFESAWRGPRAVEVREALIAGDPPIYIGVGGYRDELFVATVTLQEGEDAIVARRLRQELSRKRS